MTRRALVRKSDDLVVKIVSESQVRIDQRDPAIGPRLRVDNAPIGFEDDDYRIVEVTDAATPPAGKIRDGSARFPIIDGKAIEEFDLIDAPPAPPEPTDADRLEAATGLSVDRIKVTLGITTAR